MGSNLKIAKTMSKMYKSNKTKKINLIQLSDTAASHFVLFWNVNLFFASLT